MKINRAFIRGTNWALAGLISMLGFTTGCEKEARMEDGTPNADYTVKGTVVNKLDGKPIEGIRVGYFSMEWAEEHIINGILKYSDKPELAGAARTDAKGEFKMKENTFPISNPKVFIYMDDTDGEKNGLFQSDSIQVDFSKAEQSKKSNHWYFGEYTVNVKLELTEIKE